MVERAYWLNIHFHIFVEFRWRSPGKDVDNKSTINNTVVLTEMRLTFFTGKRKNMMTPLKSYNSRLEKIRNII